MKLSHKIAAHDAAKPFYTFEFFPPRTDQGFENLIARISRLAALDPIAISVTWGAGGSTKDQSLDLAGFTQSEYGLDTILHLTCTNMEQGLIDDVLKDVKDRGIHNLLALRGDPPRGEEEWIPSDTRFTHAIDLVSYIRASPEYSSHFCIGVAAYPDGHTDGSLGEDEELDHLKAKVDAGADFIVTQLFYDVDRFLTWLQKVRAKGITVPVIPGIMPIQTYATFARLTKLSGTKIPPALETDLLPIKNDDQLVKDYGVQYAAEMIKRLRIEGGIQGFHFCTLNLEKSVKRVLEHLEWTPVITTGRQNKLIADLPESLAQPADLDLLITPSSATNSATLGLGTIPALAEAGRGELNNAASWDDFPNGRFGDFKSPAYGNQDPWGGLGISRTEALQHWGYPKTVDDLTKIFLAHLQSRIPQTPFSPGPLDPESMTILPHLERLTKRGWWTVGSQPAVDGASSSNDVFGWGPRSGYVFQKGFVEFFCDVGDVEAIQKRIDEKGGGWVYYFMANNKGESRSNVPDEGRNAVTWGVFPGQEVQQTTIIEQESFLSWKDEAYSIWNDWANFYHPESPERKLLQTVADERWLVSVIHHDYKDPNALWTFLLDGEA
ncbi:methylenetetrahydrofolate reduct [Coprinopsis marcescibilis]|uniref:Methylenetetrahydrofolate reduct n=1 Tax=Coprinopsis marcescibilis TaxID=230819 RepID=A0A5C3LNA7_COPMA|nr:methylenetetrahydrofolate reduct [Coprinopsis marcescibilis]